MIRLIAGTGSDFGTGHLERMNKLAGYLERRGLATRIDPLSGGADEVSAGREALQSEPADIRLTVLDARDVNPESYPGKVIALDNQFHGRAGAESRIIFHDTIPHPNVPIEVAMRNCLVDPEPCESERGKQALIYAGSWSGDIPGIDQLYVQGYRAVQVGGKANDSRIIWHERLSSQSFREEMCRSSLVLTYFGMTALQAMYLKRDVLLFSIGGVHDRLSEYIAQIGVRVLGAHPIAEDFVSVPRPAIVPEGRGFELLVELIEAHK